MKKILLLIGLLSLVSACGNARTHGKFLTEYQDVWMDGYATNSDADKGLVYCRANAGENGIAQPVCYRAKFKVVNIDDD
jgi:hypothetical protein